VSDTDSGRFARQLVVLTACALIVPAQLYVAIPLKDSLADGPSALWAGSAFTMAYALGFLVWGPLSDRLGRRRMLVRGLGFLAAATAAVAVAPEPGWFLAARAAQGLAAASFAPVALVWVAERAPTARRGISLAVLTTALIGAGLAGQLYGTAALTVLNWRWTFIPSAVVYAVLAWRLRSTLGPDAPGRPVLLRAVYRPLPRLWRRKATGSVFVAALTVFGSFVALYSALARHLVDAEEFTAGHMLGVEAVGCLGLLAAPTLHLLRRSLPPRVQVIAGFCAAAAGTTTALITTMGWLFPVLGSVVGGGGRGRGGAARGGRLGRPPPP
jgi:YNFM family putative membrane transporter